MKNKIDDIIEKVPASVLEDLDMMCYGYILTKVLSIIQFGPESYRENDAFHEPSAMHSEESIRALIDLCVQMSNGRGVNQENPILIDAVADTYNFIRLLHFEVALRKSTYTSEGIIDSLKIKHIFHENSADNMSITLYFKK